MCRFGTIVERMISLLADRCLGSLDWGSRTTKVAIGSDDDEGYDGIYEGKENLERHSGIAIDGWADGNKACHKHDSGPKQNAFPRVG